MNPPAQRLRTPLDRFKVLDQLLQPSPFTLYPHKTPNEIDRDASSRWIGAGHSAERRTKWKEKLIQLEEERGLKGSGKGQSVWIRPDSEPTAIEIVTRDEGRETGPSSTTLPRALPRPRQQTPSPSPSRPSTHDFPKSTTSPAETTPNRRSLVPKSVRFSPLPLQRRFPPSAPPPTASLASRNDLVKFSTRFLPPASYGLKHGLVLTILNPTNSIRDGQVILNLRRNDSMKGVGEARGLVYRFDGNGEKIQAFGAPVDEEENAIGTSLESRLNGRLPLASFDFESLSAPLQREDDELRYECRKAYRLVSKVVGIISSRTPLSSIYHNLPNPRSQLSPPPFNDGNLRIKLTLYSDLSTHSVSYRVPPPPSLPSPSSSRPIPGQSSQSEGYLKLTISRIRNEFSISFTPSTTSPTSPSTISLLIPLDNLIPRFPSSPLFQQGSRSSYQSITKEFLDKIKNQNSKHRLGDSRPPAAEIETTAALSFVLEVLIDWVKSGKTGEMVSRMKRMIAAEDGKEVTAYRGIEASIIRILERVLNGSSAGGVEQGMNESSSINEEDSRRRVVELLLAKSKAFGDAQKGSSRRFMDGLGSIDRSESRRTGVDGSERVEIDYGIQFSDGENLTLRAVVGDQTVDRHGGVREVRLQSLEVQRKGIWYTLSVDAEEERGKLPRSLKRRLGLVCELLALF
ncbi:uncharacterized protein JCM6883_006262 [Sporobolomyces salmoneus]|uniref:uncharacterized protein n=1 Tax=Sporobolomyces salmoneus TaxID=183962 RepID=UPI00316CBED5